MKQNFELRPLKGVKRKGQIKFDRQKMRFRHFVIQQFCLFQAKDKIVGRQDVENEFCLIEFDFFLASIAPKGFAIR